MRELLNRLASEGLVVAEAQRGFEVAPASATEFREIAALRLLLEGHALALSFAAGDLDWEARVVAATTSSRSPSTACSRVPTPIRPWSGNATAPSTRR